MFQVEVEGTIAHIRVNGREIWRGSLRRAAQVLESVGFFWDEDRRELNLSISMPIGSAEDAPRETDQELRTRLQAMGVLGDGPYEREVI